MKKIQKKEKPTLESLWAYLHESKKESKKELAESRRESAEYRRRRAEELAEYRRERARERAEFKQENRELRESEEKANRELRESIKETDRQFRESMEKSSRELKESMEKSSRELKESIEETDRQLKESMKKTDEKILKVSEQLGGIGSSNGDVAEEYFQNAFEKNPTLNGEIFDKIDFNVKPLSLNGQTGNEYDIVMVNGKSVAIIEIKYNLKKNDMKEVLAKAFHKLEKFKAFYPEYKNHKFYQGIASLSFSKSTEIILQKEGIAVIKQVGDKMVINSENLKIF